MQVFSSTDLNFSDSAIDHFLSSLENRGKGVGIKIGVKKAGCSGYEYFFEYVDSINSDDIEIVEGNCRFYISAESYKILKGSHLDYVNDGLNKGIRFKNPNAKAICGCGESFTL